MSVASCLILLGLLFIVFCLVGGYLVIKSPNTVPDELISTPLKRIFPFEILKGKNKITLLIDFIGIKLGIILCCLGYFFYLLDMGISSPTPYFLLGVAVIEIGFSFGILFIPATSNIKGHMTFFVLYLCGLALLEGLEGIALLVFRPYFASEAVAYIYMAIMLILVALTFYQGFSPRLKNWAKLEKKNNEDGTITYYRGDNFTMPSAQWRLIILEASSTIVFAIILFISILIV